MFKAINNLFSTKYDLLAIGLFTGASIALMLSELFNWLLDGFVSKAIPETSVWFAVISFFFLFLKFFCIAFVLFDIDWLYNKFVRKGWNQTAASPTQQEMFVQQEVSKTIALEDLRESKTQLQAESKAQPKIQPKIQSKAQLKARLKTQLKKDQKLQQSQDFEIRDLKKHGTLNNSEDEAKGQFIVEYLQGHDDEVPSELELISVTSSKLESSANTPVAQLEPKRLVVKYQKQDQLRSELKKLIEAEDVSASNTQGLDLIALLRQDIEDSNSVGKSSKLQMKSNLYKTGAENLELSSEKVRSVLARH